MILIFHCLYLIIKSCLKISNKQFENRRSMSTQVLDSETNIVFDTPVYKQRYGEVQLILLSNKWCEDIKTLVDFGCAELKLFSFIKNLYRINDVFEVDVDEDLLIENAYKVRPLIADYISRRTEPLNVHILKGSIGDPDERLLNADVVVGIEIIEHLYPDVLDAVPYNVFGFIKPKVAIFTTPNADFNVLFPNFKGFRHDDHKFEWSREQFESWALNIVSRFPNYSVSFKGIGEGPEGTENLGCCSQMCVFIKEFDSEDNCIDFLQYSHGICTYFSLSNGFKTNAKTNSYKLLELVEYPYEIDERSPNEKILDELKYRISVMSNVNGRFYNEEHSRFEIPVENLIFNQHTHYTTIKDAGKILKEAGFKIEECFVYDKFETCVVCEPVMESRSSTPASDKSDINVPNEFYKDYTRHEPESDWEIDVDKNLWFIGPSNEEREEAMVYANEIVHNIINNLDLCQGNSNCDKRKPLNKKELEQKSGQSTAHSTQSVSNTLKNGCINLDKDGSTSLKTVKKDTSYPGISDVKKKKKSKKDVQNGLSVGIIINEDQMPQPHVEAVQEPIQEIVENGDLANNNRDLEGNNYPNALDEAAANENDNQVIQIDLQDNANRQDRRNNDVDNKNDVEQEHAAPNDEPEAQNMEVEFASREALFDPNSEVDLLEEFDVSADGEPNNGVLELPILQNIVFVGVNPNDDDAEPQIAAVLPINAEPFPNWLLNLLGAEVTEDNETHDEPHFYCQGDGLGVHPSFIEEEFDEDSSSSNSSDTITSAATSRDEAEADPSISELDVGSLPDDLAESIPEQNSAARLVAVIPEGRRTPESSNSESTPSLAREASDEFFDSIDETLNSSNSSRQIIKKDSKV